MLFVTPGSVLPLSRGALRLGQLARVSFRGMSGPGRCILSRPAPFFRWREAPYVVFAFARVFLKPARILAAVGARISRVPLCDLQAGFIQPLRLSPMWQTACTVPIRRVDARGGEREGGRAERGSERKGVS